MLLYHAIIALLSLAIGLEVDGLKILGLFPLHTKSHFIMCERLSKALSAKGHQIDVYSHFPQEQKIPNYQDFSLEGTMPDTVNNMPFEFLQKLASERSLSFLLEGMGSELCDIMGTEVFQGLFERIKEGQAYDLVIIEINIANCYLAWGRHLDVPLVGLSTTALGDWLNDPLGNPYNTAVNPGMWPGFAHPMSFVERLQNTIIVNIINVQYKYFVPVQDRYVEKYFGLGYPTITQLEKDIDLLLVNAHPILDGIRAYTPAIVPVAGLHINDDNSKLSMDVQTWLDKSEDGCIYVSFGSMVRIETLPKYVLDALYATFKNISPVRVLMKIAKPEELPPNLPKNVMMQSWFSQVQVLKHKNIRAFVTHGGLASIQESVYAGVPMVGIPLFGDQNFNVISQVRRNVAVSLQLDDITEKTLTTAFKEILNNPSYKQNADEASKNFVDRPMAPIDTAVFWIEYVARHGKKCLRSPIVDMPWWQANLIDVYAVILIVPLIALYLLKLMFLSIFFAFFPRWKTENAKKTQ